MEKLISDALPVDGATYESRRFDLTGLTLKGVTFIRCILEVRDGKDDNSLFEKCKFESCLLVGDWPPELAEGRETVEGWAERVGAVIQPSWTVRETADKISYV